MSLFPETIKQSLAGATVRLSYLVFLDFDAEPMRLWTGYGQIVSGGFTWTGVGGLGSISGLEQAVNGEAPETTLILSGVDSDIVRLTRDEFTAKARNKLVRVYVQFHNEIDDTPLTLYDDPYPIWSGRMKTARFELQSEGVRRINVAVESLFALRSRPNSSMYTSSDQQQRFAGDKGFDYVPTLLNKVVTWPDF